MLQAYGAYGEKQNYGKTVLGVIRSTFLIGADGRIEKAWRNVKATGHVARVLRGGRRRRADRITPAELRVTAVLWCTARGANLGRGAVAQLAEAHGLGPCQCGFESHRPYFGHQKHCRK